MRELTSGRAGARRELLAAIERLTLTAETPKVVALDGASDAGKPVGQRFANVFDWARVRSEALEPLIAARASRWHPFDFDGGPRADGAYGVTTTRVEKLYFTSARPRGPFDLVVTTMEDSR